MRRCTGRTWRRTDCSGEGRSGSAASCNGAYVMTRYLQNRNPLRSDLWGFPLSDLSGRGRERFAWGALSSGRIEAASGGSPVGAVLWYDHFARDFGDAVCVRQTEGISYQHRKTPIHDGCVMNECFFVCLLRRRKRRHRGSVGVLIKRRSACK